MLGHQESPSMPRDSSASTNRATRYIETTSSCEHSVGIPTEPRAFQVTSFSSQTTESNSVRKYMVGAVLPNS